MLAVYIIQVWGFYSSHNPSVVEDHMKQIQRAGAGVLVVSWYPPNQHDNEEGLQMN